MSFPCHHRPMSTVSSLSLSSLSSIEGSDTARLQPAALKGPSRMGRRGRNEFSRRISLSASSSREAGEYDSKLPVHWRPEQSQDGRWPPCSLSNSNADMQHAQSNVRLGQSALRNSPKHVQHKSQSSNDPRPPVIHYSSTACSQADESFRDPEPSSPATQQPRASSPDSFSRYFPSSRPLHIYHPATVDGNLNLSIDTQTHDGPVTLFHMRMQNIRARQFSLRRYCRESGREICHSTQECKRVPGLEDEDGDGESDAMTSIGGSGIADAKHRSISLGSMARGLKSALSRNAVADNERPRPSNAVGSVVQEEGAVVVASVLPSKPPVSPLRVDSGYASASGSPTPSMQVSAPGAVEDLLHSIYPSHLDEEHVSCDLAVVDDTCDETEDEEVSLGQRRRREQQLDKDMTRLEFSNYAHLNMRRRGKGHEFEYWDTNYTWVKVSRRRISPSLSSKSSDLAQKPRRRYSITSSRENEMRHNSQDIEYHLRTSYSSLPLASIVRDRLTPEEAALEAQLGSWVPISTFRITDTALLATSNAADVCDVLFATGLIALTDDCIRERWQESSGMLSKLPKMRLRLPGKWSSSGVFARGLGQAGLGRKRRLTFVT